MAGSGEIRVNSETARLKKDDAIVFLLGETQSITNDGEDDLELMLIGVAKEKGRLDAPGF